MPSREAKVIEQKALTETWSGVGARRFGCFTRRGCALGWGAESARTTGAGQTPNTGQSKGRHGDHKRNTKISVNTNNVLRNLGSELHL